MGRRINSLSESPCSQCSCQSVCAQKVARSPILTNIVDVMYGDADKHCEACPIYISFICPELKEEERVDEDE